ncbi:MAG TPA: hypothetical protein VGG40_00950 [Solirubrobacterales bacterium]|jgi:hypothetical protein
MRRRHAGRALLVTGLAGVVTLLARPVAWASDVFQNIGPASPLGSAASFARYPLSHYEIDEHFTAISASLTGGINTDGLLPMIAYFFASELWHLTAFVAKFVIELFAFAFSLDLVNGSSATGGAGALSPVSQAIHSIYANVFGAPWLVLAFSAVGLWAMWRALVQRRYVETAGALALSVIYIAVALFFVAEPGQTIGQASRWTNEMSQAFLSISDKGSPGGGEEATADDADQLWGLLVERPWSVLEFGGLEHCAVDGTGDEDHDPASAPVRPLSQNAAHNSALSKQLAEGTEVAAEGKTCINNANKYGSHFLQFASGTDERNEEYEALDHGNAEEVPEADKERAGYKLGVADKPATDAMEEGGQSQRLWLSLLIAVGELGALLLLGSLSIGVILAQVLLLLLLAFSPVALVAAAIPGRGHDFFKSWLEKLGGYLLRKAAYSLVLAVLLAVNAAIGDATSQLGWLFSFGLQAAFFWAVLIQRRTLAAGIVGIATGPRVPGGDLALDAVALYAGARLGLAPIRGAGRAVKGAGGFAYGRYRSGRDERRSRRLAPFLGTRSEHILDHRGGATSEASGQGQQGSARPEATAAAPAAPEATTASGDREGRAKPSGGEASTKPPERPRTGAGSEASTGAPAGPATGAAASGSPGQEGGESRESGRPGPRARLAEMPAAEREGEAGESPKGENRRGPAPSARTGEGKADDTRPERAHRQAGRPRPDGQSPRTDERAGTGEDGGGDGPAGAPKSDLSEELRAERERPEPRRDTPRDRGEARASAKDDRSAEPDSDPIPRPQGPSSPPRQRRLRRFWGRHK